MDSEWIIGALAFMTIGGVAGISIFHFGFFLKDPNNRRAAERVATDQGSAVTKVSSEGVEGRSLRQRLEEAPGVNDRLSNRPLGIAPWTALLDTPWSEIRSCLSGERQKL